MNIMRFLTPKSKVAYLEYNSTLRNGLEKMSYHGYSAIPVIDSEGMYAGTITEGDLLRAVLYVGNADIREQEKFFIKDFMREGRNPPVNITADASQVFNRITEQNFLPVIDDRGAFIGIITRKDVIKFLCDSYFDPEINKNPAVTADRI